MIYALHINNSKVLILRSMRLGEPRKQPLINH